MANESNLAHVLADKERKEPYHSDLANAGRLTVQVAQGPRTSKYPDQRDDYPGKPEERLYCYLKVRGDDKKYSYEPDTWWVADALREVPKNTWIEAEFFGAMEDADVAFWASNGEPLVDTREWEKDGERDRPAPETGQGPRTPAGQEGRERPARTERGQQTVAHLYFDAMLNASAVLSRVVEELGLWPEEAEERERYVGPVPVEQWLTLCQKVGTGMVIHADRTGMPLGPVQEAMQEVADAANGEASTEPGSVTQGQINTTATLAGLVELSETQQESVEFVVDGKASERQAKRLVAALTAKVAERQQADTEDAEGPGADAGAGAAGEEPAPGPADDDLPF